jgi:hypothetical protein
LELITSGAMMTPNDWPSRTIAQGPFGHYTRSRFPQFRSLCRLNTNRCVIQILFAAFPSWNRNMVNHTSKSTINQSHMPRCEDAVSTSCSFSLSRSPSSRSDHNPRCRFTGWAALHRVGSQYQHRLGFGPGTPSTKGRLRSSWNGADQPRTF